VFVVVEREDVMTEYHLIVSNPPHRTPDTRAAAPYMKCAVAELKMKLNFPAPEIWLAETDAGDAREVANALHGAGINVAWIPGSVLAQVPPALPATSIALDGENMLATTAAGEVAITQGDPVVTVLGEPPQQDARPTRSSGSVLTQQVPGHGPVRSMPFASGIVSAAGIAGYGATNRLDKMAQEAKDAATKRISGSRAAEPGQLFLDLYTSGTHGWKATRITQSNVDFSGLGAIMQPSARGNINAVLDTLAERPHAHVDKRLVKVAYRHSIVSGLALNQVLREISEELATQPLLDIGSKLAFLTTKGKKF
jgi:hypothetical protein